MGITLRTPVDRVPGIRPALARQLTEFGIGTVGALVAHLPFRHEKLGAEEPIAALVGGHAAAARGLVTATRSTPRGKRRFEAVLVDGKGRLDLVWFNQPYLARKIQVGARLRVRGKTTRYGPGVQMVNPEYEVLRDDAPEPGLADESLRPVYPASEAISSEAIAGAIDRVLDAAVPLIEDHLPEAYRASRSLPALAEAYRGMHRPASEDEAGSARRRLAFDELLLLQLGVQMKRSHLRRTMRAPRLAWSSAIDARIRARLGFTLTPGQERAVREVARDLASSTPTNRLIQGDVGSGKTAVAVAAMLQAVASGSQAALAAPTEILARQHAESVSAMLAGSRVRVELLTGARRADRQDVLDRLERGEIDVLIGTHAILGEGVRFKSLGLAVIDEQHRFGVHQRAALRLKGAGRDGTIPHVLVMTATPIPRSLALTLFGDLDISVIDGLPPGRLPVATRIVPEDQRSRVYEFARARLDRGEQAYVVVPTIEGDGEANALRGVEALADELARGPFAGHGVGTMHGRIKPERARGVMAEFRSGALAALVATTVIEVGVDVPNATVMIVEHAERFGLAPLHQLRGRVGRGPRAGVCLLLANPTTPEAHERLAAIAGTTDGFALAERDLAIRGPGEVFGTMQSGAAPLKVAELARDAELLAMARRDAAEWIERSPTLALSGEERLRRRLLRAYGASLGLGDVG